MDDRFRPISREPLAVHSPEPSIEAQTHAGFHDNTDHLQALEQEALLRLELADARSTGTIEPISDDPASKHEKVASINSSARWESLEARQEGLITANRAREKSALLQGVSLQFSQLCATYSLEEFERLIVLLLFAVNTSTTFRKAFSGSALGRAYSANENRDSLTVGMVLSILCGDYREQIARRRHFSVGGSLVRHEIIILLGRIDETTNILTQSVYLHERIVRYILGDDCFYDSALKNILREKSDVPLDRVILPDQIKEDVVRLVLSFAAGAARREGLGINKFYGYGTGLVLLFYGPSGTGKTMLAKALALQLNKTIFTISVKALNRHEIDDVIRYIFREARLHDGIVFFDECDDLFGEGQEMSRLLLIEIEKASCITILATNKPFQLDPSLERRITMKVPFVFPDERLRKKLWQTLVPENVALGPDVDLTRLARDYHFNGGVIKNTLFAAISEATGRDGPSGIVLGMDGLKRAADYQAANAFEKYRLSELYSPDIEVDQLPLKARDRHQLKGLAAAWKKLCRQGHGLNVMLAVSDIATGVKAVEATARACDMRIRKFGLSAVLSNSSAMKFLEPLGQMEISALDYAFSDGVGHNAISVFVDSDSQFAEYKAVSDGAGERKEIPLHLRCFMEKLRDQSGFVIVVTGCRQNLALPPEFHQLVEIGYPPEEFQIRQWSIHLGNGGGQDDAIVDLVEKAPMHLQEIDFIARQAAIRAIMMGEEGNLTIDHVMGVLDRYRKVCKSLILFGDRA